MASPELLAKAAEYDSLLRAIRIQLLEAEAHLSIVQRLFPTEDNVKALNRYKEFFRPTLSAHVSAFAIKVFNVTDVRRRAPSLLRALAMIEANSPIAPRFDVSSLRRKLDRQRSVIKKMAAYRHNRAAHWNSEASYQPPDINLGELRVLLDLFEEVWNDILVASTGLPDRFNFRMFTYDDVSQLLLDL